MSSQNSADKLTESSRWDSIKEIWIENEWLFGFIGFFAGILFSPILNSLSGSFIEDFAPEGVGILITVVIIDRYYRLRDKTSQEITLKKRLITRMGHDDRVTATNAAKELRIEGWLYDGSLSGLDFSGCNLSRISLAKANLNNSLLIESDLSETTLDEAKLNETNFHGANLEKAHMFKVSLINANLYFAVMNNATLIEADLRYSFMREVQLQEADMTRANMQGVMLSVAKLQRARFINTNLFNSVLTASYLQEANLYRANLQYCDLASAYAHKADFQQADLKNAGLYKTILQECNLKQTDFRGAYMVDADLKLAKNIDEALFDTNTTLPDQTRWTLETDMKRFTDPERKDFQDFSRPISQP